MNDSRSAPSEALTSRAESVLSAIEILARLAGLLMISLGLLSIGQAIGGVKDFSTPQTVQGLFGVLILSCAVNGSLKRSLTKFLLDSKNQRKIFLLPIAASCSIFLYRTFFLNGEPEFRSYLRTVQEGSIVEWSSFVFLIASSVLLLKAARRWCKPAGHWILLAAASGAFIVGMEEMSWGQMIFNWGTPSFFHQYNVQDETGLHNLWFIHEQTWTIASIIISIAFALSVLSGLQRSRGMVKARSIADILLPLGCTASYFFVASIFSWCTVVEKSGTDLIFFHTREQEIGELFFYSGILIHSMHLYFTSPTHTQSKE